MKKVQKLEVFMVSSIHFLFYGMVATALLTSHLAEGREEKILINGLDTKKLHDLEVDLKEHPESGKAIFFSNTRWKGGMKSITTFSEYEIDGKFIGKERKFTLSGDGLKEMGGEDTSPGAIEELMYAVGTCIVTSANANAALMGVKLSKIEVELESSIDMHGLMGLDSKVPSGVLDFKTTIKIAGDASEEILRKIAIRGYLLSPVSDTVRNGVLLTEPLKIVVEK